MLSNPDIKTFLISKSVLVLILMFGTPYAVTYLSGLMNLGTSTFISYVVTFVCMLIILIVGGFAAEKIWGVK